MKAHIIALAILAIFLVSSCTTGNVVADVTAEDSEQQACTDSDGGIEIREKGTANGYDVEGATIERTDQCVPPFLVEYYCEDGIVKNRNIRCQVCDRGTCPIVINVGNS